MPRRSPAGLAEVADLSNLAAAFWQAARGKRARPEVVAFATHLDTRLTELRTALLEGQSPMGRWRSFRVFDPKERLILAPCFEDRVLHHALMAVMSPVLERALVADTFACRVGRGTLAAVERAQHHVRRFPWYVKVDVRAYFASIDHRILLGILERRFKDAGLLGLCARILAAVPGGVGLPIGALTSQHFANTYLDAVDRHLLEGLRVQAMVRYMDDIVWWCDDHATARATLASLQAFVQEARHLELKPPQLGQSRHGVPFLGFRILPRTLRLSIRRRRRFAAARAKWERAYREGQIDARGLQAGMAAALAIVAHADSQGWRRGQLERHPPLDV